MYNDLKNELATNFIEYAVAVNSDRSIPDAKSGLKPVAKRILWDTYINGYHSNKPHVKCAQIVGDTMARFHPHGDTSIYDALVRLSRPWIMRYPLIDFHGNNGNIDGDGPAAPRYTEARLAKIVEDGIFANIKTKNVDFVSNYSETEDEPLTLPNIFPNLLCNPNSGIGVALACSWLPHNLKEVADAIKFYLKGGEPMLPGPDFPTGGIIINKKDIPAIMRTGHGSVKVRGKYTVEKNKIIFTEIPYGQTVEDLIDQIGAACDKKDIEGISDIRNESNKHGLRIVVECQKGINPETIVAILFEKTNLQSSISYNQVALVDKSPLELNLKQTIEIYVKHNIACLIKELNFKMEKIRARLHILEGLLKAIANIDDIIKLIKSSGNSTIAKENLIKSYSFSEAQATAILDMKLAKLAKLEAIELEKEKAKLTADFEECNTILTNKEKQIEVIVKRLDELVVKYGDSRRTELTDIEIKKSNPIIIPEDVMVIATKSGMIKRVPLASFKVQKRNGKGVKNYNDIPLNAISTNTVDSLMIFTNLGRIYSLSVDKVPIGTNLSKGVNINTLIEGMKPEENVEVVTSLYKDSVAKYVVFITKKGLIKKTELSEYKTSGKRGQGAAALKIKEGDSIANVLLMSEEDIILATKQGMGIHFGTKLINPIGRLTLGRKAITLNENDEVLCGLPIHNEKDCLAIFSEDGHAVKHNLDILPKQIIGGKGHRIYSNEKEVKDISLITDEDNLLIVGKPNSICISAADIPFLQSATSIGVKIINETRVSSVSKF